MLQPQRLKGDATLRPREQSLRPQLLRQQPETRRQPHLKHDFFPNKNPKNNPKNAKLFYFCDK